MLCFVGPRYWHVGYNVSCTGVMPADTQSHHAVSTRTSGDILPNTRTHDCVLCTRHRDVMFVVLGCKKAAEIQHRVISRWRAEHTPPMANMLASALGRQTDRHPRCCAAAAAAACIDLPPAVSLSQHSARPSSSVLPSVPSTHGTNILAAWHVTTTWPIASWEWH